MARLRCKLLTRRAFRRCRHYHHQNQNSNSSYVITTSTYSTALRRTTRILPLCSVRRCASVRSSLCSSFARGSHALGKGSVGMATRYSTCHLSKDWAFKSARASMMRNSTSELRVFYLRLPRLIVALQRAVDCNRKVDTRS